MLFIPVGISPEMKCLYFLTLIFVIHKVNNVVFCMKVLQTLQPVILLHFRLSAVFGGIYVLNLSVSHIVTDADNR